MGLIKSTESFSIANMMNNFNQDYGINCASFTPQFRDFNCTTPNSCFTNNVAQPMAFEANNSAWNNWALPNPVEFFTLPM